MQNTSRAASLVDRGITNVQPAVTLTAKGRNCLHLNQLARNWRTTRQGPGITLFKKIGDRVERSEPPHRIHAFEQSEFDLAVSMARADSGYVISSLGYPRGNYPEARTALRVT